MTTSTIPAQNVLADAIVARDAATAELDQARQAAAGARKALGQANLEAAIWSDIDAKIAQHRTERAREAILAGSTMIEMDLPAHLVQAQRDRDVAVAKALTVAQVADDLEAAADRAAQAERVAAGRVMVARLLVGSAQAEALLDEVLDLEAKAAELRAHLHGMRLVFQPAGPGQVFSRRVQMALDTPPANAMSGDVLIRDMRQIQMADVAGPPPVINEDFYTWEAVNEGARRLAERRDRENLRRAQMAPWTDFQAALLTDAYAFPPWVIGRVSVKGEA